ncbi:BppU family phage baseplate upper protein [Bacillus cereus]
MKTRLILDINKTQYAQLNSLVTGRVGDKASNTVDVYVVDGFVPYNLTGSDVYFECAKPDNTSVRDKNGIAMIDASKGHFEYTFPAQTFASVGKSKQAYFTVEKNSTVKATTQDFIIVSIPDALTNRIPSQTYISQLEELIWQLEQIELDLLNSAAYQEAHDAKIFAEQAKSISESVKAQLDQIVIQGSIDPETKQARVDSNGFAYPLLKDRIDAEQVRITEIAMNVKTLGVKGDGITDDTTAIEKAFRDNPYKIMYFPDGNYRVTRPIRISADNSLELSKNARIYADAAIDYIFDFNTSRKINSIYDLSKDCFIIGEL